MFSLPDYRDRPMARNPYFLWGTGLVFLGAVTHWLRGRPDDIKEELPAEASTGLVVPSAGSSGTLTLTKSDLTPAEVVVFKRALPARGQPYADFFVRAGREKGVSPFILAALMHRESNYGKGCKLPACRGYAGDDYGLMQINQRAHPAFFAKQVNGRPAYEDPWSVIQYGAGVFGSYKKMLAGWFPQMTDLEILRATASSYNAGPGNVRKALNKGKSPDSVTTGGDYGKDVLAKATALLTGSAVA